MKCSSGARCWELASLTLPTLAFSAIFQVTRPSEPWEFSDGAVYLVRELCVANPDLGVTFFEEIADVARLTHFVQADCLRETIWKQVCPHFLMFSCPRALFRGHFYALAA